MYIPQAIRMNAAQAYEALNKYQDTEVNNI